MSTIARLDIEAVDFEAAFARLLVSPAEADVGLTDTVSNIVAAVAREGDSALLRFTNELDHRSVPEAAALHLDKAAMEAAAESVEAPVRDALSHAAERIRDFHEHQLAHSWQYEDESGTILGQRV